MTATCQDSLHREFRGVRKNTSFPGLFESTAKIPLTRKSDAIRLLQMVAYHCKKTGMPTVTWGKRSWAKWRTKHIQLENPGLDTLTVHVVLHEYAHIMACTKRVYDGKRRQPHGRVFRLYLDGLMILWRDRIRPDFQSQLQE